MIIRSPGYLNIIIFPQYFSIHKILHYLKKKSTHKTIIDPGYNLILSPRIHFLGQKAQPARLPAICFKANIRNISQPTKNNRQFPRCYPKWENSYTNTSSTDYSTAFVSANQPGSQPRRQNQPAAITRELLK